MSSGHPELPAPRPLAERALRVVALGGLGEIGRNVAPGAAALEQAMAVGTTDPYQLQQVIHRAVGRWVSDRFRRRPMIIPVVLEV